MYLKVPADRVGIIALWSVFIRNQQGNSGCEYQAEPNYLGRGRRRRCHITMPSSAIEISIGARHLRPQLDRVLPRYSMFRLLLSKKLIQQRFGMAGVLMDCRG